MDGYVDNVSDFQQSLRQGSWAAPRILKRHEPIWGYKYRKVRRWNSSLILELEKPGTSASDFNVVRDCWVVDSLPSRTNNGSAPDSNRNDGLVLLFSDGSLAFVSYREYRGGSRAELEIRDIEPRDILALDFAKTELHYGGHTFVERSTPWSPVSDREPEFAPGVYHPGDGFRNVLHALTGARELGTAPLPSSPSLADRKIGEFNQLLESSRDESKESARISKGRELNRLKDNHIKAVRDECSSWWARRRGVASFCLALLGTFLIFNFKFHPEFGSSYVNECCYNLIGGVYANGLVHLTLFAVLVGMATGVISRLCGRFSIVALFAFMACVCYIILVHELVVTDFLVSNLQVVRIAGLDGQGVGAFFTGTFWKNVSIPIVTIILGIFPAKWAFSRLVNPS